VFIPYMLEMKDVKLIIMFLFPVSLEIASIEAKFNCADHKPFKFSP